MKVSANSWHMKLCNKVEDGDYEPTNLCEHFWTVVLYLVLAGAVSGLTLVLIGSAGLLIFLLGLLIWNLMHDWSILITILKVVGVVVGGTVLGLSVFGAVGYVVSRATSRLERRERAPKEPKPKKEKKERNPNILWAYIKALKGRYCPLIEVVE